MQSKSNSRIPQGVTSPTELARILGVSYKRATQLLYPEKYRARLKVREAIKSGRLVKPEICEACNEDGWLLEGHHPDYDQPLMVRWLCGVCHSVEHRDKSYAPYVG